jgi:Spy/CpxP family protein refolding chaperone
MNRKRFAKQMAVAAGFCLLSTAPGLTRAQSSSPSPAQAQRPASPAAQPKKGAPPTDVYAGLEFTDDQKARIVQIRKDMKSRLDVLAKDEKLNGDQKQAMLEGYRRMENNAIFDVLTPEQQAEVRKRAHAQRAANQPGQKKKRPGLQ